MEGGSVCRLSSCQWNYQGRKVPCDQVETYLNERKTKVHVDLTLRRSLRWQILQLTVQSSVKDLKEHTSGGVGKLQVLDCDVRKLRVSRLPACVVVVCYGRIG